MWPDCLKNERKDFFEHPDHDIASCTRQENKSDCLSKNNGLLSEDSGEKHLGYSRTKIVSQGLYSQPVHTDLQV